MIIFIVVHIINHEMHYNYDWNKYTSSGIIGVFFVMYEILSCLNPVNIHYETLLPILKLFLLLLHQNKQKFHSTKHALQVAPFGNNMRKFF